MGLWLILPKASDREANEEHRWCPQSPTVCRILGWAPNMGTRSAFAFMCILTSQEPCVVGILRPTNRWEPWVPKGKGIAWRTPSCVNGNRETQISFPGNQIPLHYKSCPWRAYPALQYMLGHRNTESHRLLLKLSVPPFFLPSFLQFFPSILPPFLPKSIDWAINVVRHCFQGWEI